MGDNNSSSGNNAVSINQPVGVSQPVDAPVADAPNEEEMDAPTATVAVEEGAETSSTPQPDKGTDTTVAALADECLKPSQVDALIALCTSLGAGCASNVSSTDSLGHSYFEMTAATGNSLCTPSNGGRVNSVIDPNDTSEDPQVWCAFVKELCPQE